MVFTVVANGGGCTLQSGSDALPLPSFPVCFTVSSAKNGKEESHVQYQCVIATPIANNLRICIGDQSEQGLRVQRLVLQRKIEQASGSCYEKASGSCYARASHTGAVQE